MEMKSFTGPVKVTAVELDAKGTFLLNMLQEAEYDPAQGQMDVERMIGHKKNTAIAESADKIFVRKKAVKSVLPTQLATKLVYSRYNKTRRYKSMIRIGIRLKSYTNVSGRKKDSVTNKR